MLSSYTFIHKFTGTILPTPFKFTNNHTKFSCVKHMKIVSKIGPFNLYIKIGRHWYTKTCNHHITDKPQANTK